MKTRYIVLCVVTFVWVFYGCLPSIIISGKKDFREKYPCHELNNGVKYHHTPECGNWQLYICHGKEKKWVAVELIGDQTPSQQGKRKRFGPKVGTDTMSVFIERR